MLIEFNHLKNKKMSVYVIQRIQYIIFCYPIYQINFEQFFVLNQIQLNVSNRYK